jgi:hypothetical protein
MSHTALRTARAVALTALATFVAAPDLRADQPRVVIRLYDTAAVGDAARANAMRTAAAIVQDAGITVEWRDCSRGGAEYPCRTVRGARDLVVRIMPTYVPRPRLPEASVSTRETFSEPDLQLGFAAVDSATHIGVMATIYHDRVLTVTRRASVDYGELLGRAMAHEIGHLLLHVAGHSPTGLMRAVWTDAELTQNRREDWVFAPAERRQLRAASAAADALDRTQALAIPAALAPETTPDEALR